MSMRAAVSTPSLQLTKWYPAFGTAVTVVPLPPWFTVCGVVPLMEPLGPAL